MIEHLAARGIEHVSEKRVIDMWFAPKSVQSHEQQQQWFDVEHGVAYRLRTTTYGGGTDSTVSLESKQLTSDNDHNTFTENVLEDIDTSDKAVNYLSEMGYWNWLTIDKTRHEFKSENSHLEIVIDEIAGLAEKIGIGAALEIEYKGEASRDEALQMIDGLANELGLSADQLFEKSLTVESMTELAKFQ
jgi:adenylate cyclase class IV